LVTLGAVTENDLSAMFVGTNLTYTVLSTNPAVMSAEITLNDDLRTMALSHGLTEIIVTATDPLTLITQTNAFAIKVVDHPTLVSSVYPPHEPWNPRFVQQIEVRNDDTCDAIGLRLMFTDLKPGIVVENQNAVEPDDGRPAIVLSFPFQPGESKTLSVVYLSSGAFRPDQSPPTVEIEYVLPDVPPGPQGKTGPNIQRIETLGDGRVVLEFNSVAGLHYRIELMDNYPSHPWITVALDLLAGANRTQWIDHGPPATPVPSGLRVYRVLQVLP
ncbi:MAG: hypothetical protein U1E27_05045, partial [Kiritimatiellia bacterium]|nr:hypothetical protein [Kiritimatiellia bacterium]